MSRLDYITIGIVAACILAIIFLVYKMTDLFGGEPTSDSIENTTKKVEEEGDSTTYDYKIDEEKKEVGEATTDDSANTNAANGNDTKTTSDNSATKTNEEDEVRTPVNTDRPTSTITRSTGKYMVIAGTFSKKASAQQQLKKLKGMGFNNASIEPFDRGKFDVVLVDRFDNMAAAERLVKDLKAEGVSSYVKAKEGN